MFSYQYHTAWSFHRSTVHTIWNAEGAVDTQGVIKADCGYAQPGTFKSYSAATIVKLPDPEAPAMPLGAAIADRASCRRFSSKSLTASQLSAVLGSAYGVSQGAVLTGTAPCERPVPSAGGCYPLELYPLLWNIEGIRSGTYHYQPVTHALEFLQSEPQLSTIPSLFLNQPYLAEVGALLILTGVIERQLFRYGDRGYRYLLIEAGHVAQNIGLVAAAVDMGCLTLGGFLDDSVAALLNLDQDSEVALYGVALGSRATQDRVQGRGL